MVPRLACSDKALQARSEAELTKAQEVRAEATPKRNPKGRSVRRASGYTLLLLLLLLLLLAAALWVLSAVGHQLRLLAAVCWLQSVGCGSTAGCGR